MPSCDDPVVVLKAILDLAERDLTDDAIAEAKKSKETPPADPLEFVSQNFPLGFDTGGNPFFE